jgi:hypothetical protein
LFRIEAKRRNLKRNENETKRKQNEKEAKTAIILALKLNEAKQKRNFFVSMQKKCILHMKRNENEMKQKLNEKGAKTSERKRIK